MTQPRAVRIAPAASSVAVVCVGGVWDNVTATMSEASTKSYLTTTVRPDTGKAAGTVAPAVLLGTLCPFGPAAVTT